MTPDPTAFQLEGDSEGRVADDRMDVERPLFIPFSQSLYELQNYGSDDMRSPSPPPCHLKSPCTPPRTRQNMRSYGMIHSEANQSNVRRIGGPTIEEQQESDRAYFESEHVRSSPSRPLKREKRIYDESTSTLAWSMRSKKVLEIEHDIFKPREKRTRDCDSDDEDPSPASKNLIGEDVFGEDGHRSKRVRIAVPAASSGSGIGEQVKGKSPPKAGKTKAGRKKAATAKKGKRSPKRG